jgi:4-amino-4-deoxy-L-arabinose transferase-like glycosyltransferase
LLLLGSFAFAQLMALPAFEDEGSQLRGMWRLIEAGEWLQPLGEGKPLEAWLMVPLLRLGGEPLAAIRALHVVAGMIGAVLTYRLALHLATGAQRRESREAPAARRGDDRWTAFTCGALFALCPFVVYLERLALADIFLCATGIWVLVSVLEFIQSPNWMRTAALAAGLVLAAFCKFPVGFVFLASMPLALTLLPSHERRTLLHPPVLAKVLAAHAPAAILALVVSVTAIIRLAHGQPPGFGLQDLVGVGMGQYQDIATVIGVPRPNLVDELTVQLSWPVAALALIGLAASALSGDWRLRWLIAVGALPMLGIGLLAGFWFSRYLLFTLPPLIVGAVSGWRRLLQHARRFRLPVEAAVLAVCVGFMGYQSALLIFDPAAARWSALDRFQYFEGWSSGYGFPEAARFVLETRDAPQMIYSLDGHSAYQLRNYLPAQWNSRVRPVFYGPDGKALLSETARLENLLSRTPAWIIIPEQLLQGYLDSSFGRTNSGQINLRRIATFDKPGSRARLAIYDVTRR